MSEEIDAHVLRKYDRGERVGKGAYGIVWKCCDKKTKRTVALKKIFDAFQNSTDAQRTFREIMFLQELNQYPHENIIRLLNVLKADNDRDIYLIFEHMDISLHAAIRAGILGDIHKRFVLYQTVKALKYLHSGELIHRDMKPSNLLLNSDCHVKLIDFGLARSVAETKEQDTLTDYVATRWYRAPEILLGSPQYTKAVDMWSVGCIMGEMLGGKAMFPGESTTNQLERVLQITGMPTDEQIKSIKSKFAAGMIGCVRVRVRGRLLLEEKYPDASEEAIDLLSKLLRFDPKDRISAAQMLSHPFFKDFHDSKDEPTLKKPIRIKFDDNKRFSIEEYRKSLYKQIIQKRKEMRRRKKERKKQTQQKEKDSKHKRRSHGGNKSAW
eukprot:CAMPEP_0197529230 /NCGR_PEP_ID=MMETSP1318-20131121/27678_1 /TAXON_ID=552666 /ORGANISM="Partenskyella glossopodia, Strain RCC365" /LENGTH=381 /DNA_ID=CAMNT_0043084613 /DNA_START=354 /DNA_END=1502 /DNA_ORIENTATION=-